ncbi:ABC transporter substrate-binding protein [Rhodococcus sp. GB-02]|uniref:ABC transporter substrate-binding protein n=1 Tax=Rhodococcus erythropolis TaxID=1833 RepID=UPI001E394460|nr:MULTISPECIES: ABC transporter substrate-binding protein [Rhodococcus erythropolis group]MCD2108544.1 ABC transporter substrate-binding protein [Rhodococcus qingshengii]MCZ4527435.1 ABC transporter substrate-binding protein [Rhodococcus erythropolis]
MFGVHQGRFALRGLREKGLAFAAVGMALSVVAGCGSAPVETDQAIDLTSDPAACADGDATPAIDRASGPFTFTDGRGRTIALDRQPERIIADEESAAALYSYGIKPIAIWSTTPMDKSPILQCLDLTGVQSVGEAWGSISVESVLALVPDLIVGEYNPRFEQFGKLTTKGDTTKSDVLDSAAPTLGVTLETTSTEKTIDNYQELARALGVNIDGGRLAEIKADFEAAVENFRRVAADKKDVIGMGIWPLDVAYVLDPTADPDFSDYVSWGLAMYRPEATDDGYWKKISWENITTVDADLMFVYHDVANAADVQLSELSDQYPTFGTLSGVDAGQMVLWDYGANKSYPRYTKTINAFADALSKSEPVIPADQ